MPGTDSTASRLELEAGDRGGQQARQGKLDKRRGLHRRGLECQGLVTGTWDSRLARPNVPEREAPGKLIYTKQQQRRRARVAMPGLRATFNIAWPLQLGSPLSLE